MVVGQEYRFCGEELPEIVKIDGGQAKVVFHSDGHVMNKGFQMKFRFEEPEYST